MVFKGSSGHGRRPSLVGHNQSPFPAGPQTPAQTYQTSHPQSEWENIFLIILPQFSVLRNSFFSAETHFRIKTSDNIQRFDLSEIIFKV